MDKGYVATKAEYLKQFFAALISRIGVTNANAVLAYESDNELFFDASQAPYNRMSGTVTPMNGVTYNMSNTVDRQQSADASLVEYSHRIKRGLQSAAPDAFLTVGFFTNKAVGKTGFNGLTTYCSTNCQPSIDYRVPGRAAALSIYGTADFLDIHVYPQGGGYTLLSDLNSIEQRSFNKPYIIGEFGALKSAYSNDIIKAAHAMRDLRRTTCSQHKATGWIFWTWDTTEDLAYQTLLFTMSQNRGAINGQLCTNRSARSM
jgi:hypothetical protein